jgi:hypothetical protein
MIVQKEKEKDNRPCLKDFCGDIRPLYRNENVIDQLPISEQFNLFSNDLTEKQFRKICRYWKIIEKLQYKVDHFNWYASYSSECKECKERVINKFDELNLKVKHFEEEYENYIHKLGFHLKDKTQNEHLYQLLNDGIVLD